MIQSYMWLVLGIITLGAGIESWINGNVKMALISGLYSLADFVLATMKQ